MVVGVWELVLFLWNHPIISCMVVLLFSPPFFPIVVYFSPLLICTGLVAVAMVSMNMGGGGGGGGGVESDEAYSIRRLHESSSPGIEPQLKPAKEGWVQWMWKLEGRGKEWVETRILNRGKSQFGGQLLPPYGIAERGIFPDPVLDEGDEERSSPFEGEVKSISDDVVKPNSSPELGHESTQPTQPPTSRDFPPPMKGHDFTPQLPGIAEEVEEGGPRAFEGPSQEIEPAVECGEVGGPLEGGDPASVMVALVIVKQEGPQREIMVLSMIADEEVLAAATEGGGYCSKEIAAVCPIEKGAKPQQQPLLFPEMATSGEEQMSPSVDSNVSKEVVGAHFERAVDASQTVSEADDPLVRLELRVSTHDALGHDPEIPARVSTGEKGLCSDTSKISMSPKGGLGNRLATEEELPPPNARTASENWKRLVSAALKNTISDPGHFVGASSSDDLGTTGAETEEKIVLIDEPLELSRALDPEIRRVEAPDEKSSSGEVEESGALFKRVSKDESSEVCKSVPTTAEAPLEVVDPPPALPSRDGLAADNVSPHGHELEHHPTGHEVTIAAPDMEVVPTDGTGSSSTALAVVDDGHSSLVKSDHGEENEEEDDLTERYAALKKTMSLYKNKKGEDIPQEEQQSTSESGPNPTEMLMMPHLKKDADVESVEAITDRLQKKYATALGKEEAIIIPAKNLIRTTSSTTTEPAMTGAIVPVSVVSIDSGGGDKDSCTAVVNAVVIAGKRDSSSPPELSTPTKKSLTSFLTRRREKLFSPLLEAFSNVGDGDRVKKSKSSGSSSTANPTESAPFGEENGNGESSSSVQTGTPGAKFRKGKLISPLKRVLSMDFGALSDKKGEETGVRVLASNGSPNGKDKQSAKDKSKDKFKKLFSFDARGTGGKCEPPEKGGSSQKNQSPAKSLLRKSKSVSANRSLKATDGENSPALDGNLLALACIPDPLPEIRGIERAESESGTLALARIDFDGAHVEDESRVPPKDEKAVVATDAITMLDWNFTEGTPKPSPISKNLTVEARGVDTTPPEEQPRSKPSHERKFSLSWTKKKRPSEPWTDDDPTAARPSSPEENSFFSGKFDDEDLKFQVGPPLERPTTPPTTNSSSAAAVVGEDPPSESRSSDVRSFWPNLNLKLRDSSQKSTPPGKKGTNLWWSSSSKGDPTAQAVISPGKRLSAAWWSRKNQSKPDSKPDSEPLQQPTSQLRPTISTTTTSNKSLPSGTANSPERSLVLYSPPRLSSTNHDDGHPRQRDTLIIDSDVSAETPEDRRSLVLYSPPRRKPTANDKSHRQRSTNESGVVWHTRCRSDSVPSNIDSGSKFRRVRERQASFSEALLSQNNNRAQTLTKSTSSLDRDYPTTDDSFEDDHHHHHHPGPVMMDHHYSDGNSKFTSRLLLSSSTTTPPPPLPPPISFQSTLSSSSGSSSNFSREMSHRQNWTMGTELDDVHGRLRRVISAPAAGAEIKITDKLKVPLDEVLSLLSSGEKADLPTPTTAASAHHDAHSSSSDDDDDDDETSSSDDDGSSKEEWSSDSEENEVGEGEEQPKQEFTPLPPPARVRRKLPHYIFHRAETAAKS